MAGGKQENRSLYIVMELVDGAYSYTPTLTRLLLHAYSYTPTLARLLLYTVNELYSDVEACKRRRVRVGV
jgi:hypothetical protein